ncbi:MAG TPA: aspartate-semialdehyde dehydrogenase [Rectinemataceae bacterium]|nr:aspartate-semialdehyde dehydrogenase [Rectinemataceae bacterium]
MSRIPVTILGATGVVGQRFVRRLAEHPSFAIQHLAASERSVGKAYAEACDWRLPGEIPSGLGSLRVLPCDPAKAFAPVVFSALDAAVALEIEPLFAAAGAMVFSNASPFRMEEDVPLLIPELNAAHLALVELQRRRRGWKGAILCNPNCTTAVLCGALGPLHRSFGLESALVVSMQALSGAGYPGVPSLDAVANVIPYIGGEEEKVETEARKILGTFDGRQVVMAPFTVSASCNRVPVVDGHTISASLRLSGSPDPEAVSRAIEGFKPDTEGMSLPTAPRRFVQVRTEKDRPQPRRDADEDGGMRIQVGRVRSCPIMGVKMTILGHNTERGAAGASVLNAELALASGLLP